MGKDSAFAGVEKRIVLQDADRGLDGIEARTAALQHGVASLERLFDSFPMRLFVLRCHLAALDRARTAMDYHAEFHWLVFLLCCDRSGHEQCAEADCEVESKHT